MGIMAYDMLLLYHLVLTYRITNKNSSSGCKIDAAHLPENHRLTVGDMLC